MPEHEFDSLVSALRDGRLTAHVFFTKTRAVWERLARYLLRRWRVPAWYSEEEVMQELMLAGYHFVWKYDPERSKGRTIARYVTWNALDKAKKEIHVVRQARLSGDADCNPSRIDRLFSTYEVPPEPQIEATQEEGIERQEAVAEAANQFATARERMVVQALAENRGNVEDTALQMSSHAAFTGALDAARFVVSVAEKLVAQAAA